MKSLFMTAYFEAQFSRTPGETDDECSARAARLYAAKLKMRGASEQTIAELTAKAFRKQKELL